MALKQSAGFGQWIEKNSAPVTLGVIEAEVSSEDQRSKMRQLAAMPQVRLASHTYSHPFYWGVFEGKKDADQQPYRYSVFMEGYAADITRETAGTVPFLQSIAPSSPLLIWSGDGRPDPQLSQPPKRRPAQLWWRRPALAERIVIVRRSFPGTASDRMGHASVDAIDGRAVICATVVREALNFGKVSDWNRQLDLGRRLRVSSISINADALLHARGAELLDQLAEEQRKENLLGIWVHEYVQRVRAFQTASIARDLEGDWMLFGDALRTVRLPASGNGAGNIRRHSRLFRTQCGAAIFIWRAIMPFSNPQRRIRQRSRKMASSALRLIEASAPLKSWHVNSDGSATLLFEAAREFDG